jgi:predicted acetyltransferase
MFSKINCTDKLLPLFKKYMAHMSQFFKIDDYDAWYDRAMQYLKLYEIEPDRHIFTLTKEDEIVGFAFVNTHLRLNKSGFAVAEFYICPPFNKCGYGRKLAEFVFSQFPGCWEVAVTRNNKAGLSFWQKVVSNYTDDQYEELQPDMYDGYIFTFVSGYFTQDNRCF